MADINTLLGLGIGNDERLRETADRLRGQQRAGQYLGLSTLAPVQQLGQNIAKGAATSAKAKLLNENKVAAAEELAKTKARAAEVLNENKVAAAEELAKTNARAAEVLNENKVAAAKLKADALNLEDFKPYVRNGKPVYIAQKGEEVFELDEDGDILKTTMKGVDPYEKPTRQSDSPERQFGALTKKERADFEGGVAAGIEALDVLDKYEKDFSISETLGIDIEGTPLNAMDNWAAGTLGFGSKRDKEKAKWWRILNRLVELPERHKLFGSALTATEKAAWQKAAIAETLEPKLAEDLIEELRGIIRERIRKAAGNTLFKGATPEYVKFNTNSMFTDMDSVNKKPRTRKLDVSPQGNLDVSPQGNLDDETVTTSELKEMGYTREQAEDAGLTVVEG